MCDHNTTTQLKIYIIVRAKDGLQQNINQHQIFLKEIVRI